MLTRRSLNSISRRKDGKLRSRSHSTKSIRDKHHHQGKHAHQKDNYVRSNKDLSKLKCYTCDERGHFARDCPRNKRRSSPKKKGNKRRHHAHAVEDDEPSTKRSRQVSDDSSSE